MSATVGRKPRRRGRRPGPGLTREDILTQALVLLDQTGIEGFSIRRLAEVLDVTPMALYHYFESYDDLLRGVVSLVLDEVEIPVRGNTDWRAATCKLLVSLRKQLLEHPHVLGLLSSVEYWGPTLIRVADQLFSLLTEAGFSKRAAARAHRALIRHTFGSLLLTAADPRPDHAARIERIREHLRQMPMLNSERMGSMLSLVLPINVDLDREFAFSLDRLLAGLEAGLGEPQATRRNVRASKSVARREPFA
jgi:AcrR family transcriptional regulator